MDIVDRHFAAENAHDVESTLSTYTDDIVWDNVTYPDAPFYGKEEVAGVYTSILDAIPDVVLESVKRFSVPLLKSHRFRGASLGSRDRSPVVDEVIHDVSGVGLSRTSITKGRTRVSLRTRSLDWDS